MPLADVMPILLRFKRPFMLISIGSGSNVFLQLLSRKQTFYFTFRELTGDILKSSFDNTTAFAVGTYMQAIT